MLFVLLYVVYPIPWPGVRVRKTSDTVLRAPSWLVPSRLERGACVRASRGTKMDIDVEFFLTHRLLGVRVRRYPSFTPYSPRPSDLVGISYR